LEMLLALGAGELELVHGSFLWVFPDDVKKNLFLQSLRRAVGIFPKAAPFVAQICNLLYRKIAFCGGANIARAPCSAMASRLQMGDTAECNSALHLDVFAVRITCNGSDARAAPIRPLSPWLFPR